MSARSCYFIEHRKVLIEALDEITRTMQYVPGDEPGEVFDLVLEQVEAQPGKSLVLAAVAIMRLAGHLPDDHVSGGAE